MIRHISAIAEVVDDVDAAVEFYRDVLGLSVEHQPGGGYATVEISGGAPLQCLVAKRRG